MKKVIGILSIAFLLASCGGGGDAAKKEEKSGPKIKSQSSTKAKDEKPSDVPEMVEVTIEGNDQMQFNKDKIEVYAGQTVKLTLKHVGEMALEAMGHNWTLLKPGTDINEFGAASVGAKDNDYLPKEYADRVIAKTKTIGGGEEVTIEFTAPGKGTYDYICAFPGHYAQMQGKLIVK